MNKHLNMRLVHIPRDIKDSVIPFLLYWQWKSEIHERIECDGDLTQNTLNKDKLQKR